MSLVGIAVPVAIRTLPERHVFLESPTIAVMDTGAGQAYSRRAAEYAERFGSMAAIHPSDRQVVDTWIDTIAGPVIDAGCGPGHWTSYMVSRGVAAYGVDVVPAFIAHARTHYPEVSFEVGNIDALDAATESVGGVLSWYSVIHHPPDTIQVPLREFARVLRPGGGLLVGFFEGAVSEKFDHAIASAYKWPVTELGHELDRAGFDVIEAHTRTGAAERPRPHGAIVARRR